MKNSVRQECPGAGLAESVFAFFTVCATFSGTETAIAAVGIKLEKGLVDPLDFFLNIRWQIHK
jgi:hypothetical protein